MTEPAEGGARVVPLRQDASGAAPPPPGGEGASKGKGKKRQLPPSFFDHLRTLTDQFALIHGTDTAWDGVHRIVIKVAHMRLTYGNDAVKAWLGSADRKMVTKEQVVFDPTMTVDPKTHVNLFGGMERTPKAGDCAFLLDLLGHLAGGDPKIVQWILRWIALPLQRPGTKMATAIIMHGAEGTGKNLFWGAVQSIYGRYGVMIGQAQIESEFNGWLSAKLFVTGNEVLGRKEKWELKGALKHLVTEDFIYINEKMMPERVERNHANLVFLSNELQPLVLGQGDRRYMVVETWHQHPEGDAFYARVRNWLNDGGVEAFYAHLLALPLGEFGPHTKPLDTTAKRELVELGKDEPERFLEEWKAGGADLPYGVATAGDLYIAFRRWCMRNGERHIPTMQRFGRVAKLRFASRVMKFSLSRGMATDDKQWTVYWDGEAVPDSCEDLDAWVRRGAQKFRDAAFDPSRGDEER